MKFECQKELHGATTCSKFATLDNGKEENDFKEIVAEEDMNNTWTKDIERGQTKSTTVMLRSHWRFSHEGQGCLCSRMW